MTVDAPLVSLDGLICRRGGAGGFTLEVPRLSLPPGGVLAVTGPSGSGKSTLLDCLGLALRPAAANAFAIGGVDVAAAWRAGDSGRLAAVRAATIGYILQTGGLLPFLSVRRNIGLSPALLGRPAEPGHLARLIEALGLAPHLDKMPAALSIGERQRVAIARALAHRPALLLADEPTASLDPVNAEAVLALLLRLARDSGAALILVSHDWDRVAAMGVPRLIARIGSGDGARARFVPAEGSGS